MEFPSTVPPANPPGRRRPGALLAAAALAAYAVLLLLFMDPYAGGSDTSGYLNHARLLYSGRVHIPFRALEGLPPEKAPYDVYTPLGLKPAPDGNGLVPTYPSGLPLLLAAAARAVGWVGAAALVAVAHAVIGILMVYALGRAFGLPRAWAATGAVMVAASPLYVLYSVQVMSDVPSLAWVAAALLAAWRAGDPDGPGAGPGWRWALASGAALSVAVLIRPNSIIALAPIAAALGPRARRWPPLVLGGLPCAAFFCLHARAAYGSPLATGYGDSSYLFSAAWAPPTLAHFALWLPVLFTPAVLAAAGLPWSRSGPVRARVVIAVWILVYLAFYSCYAPSHETWWYLRFLLPAAPALVAGGLLVIHGAVGRRCGGTAFAAALALVLANGALLTRHLGVLNTRAHDRTYPAAMDWMGAHLPPNALVAAWQTSGALFYYTPFAFFRWENLDARSFGVITAAAQRAGRPVYAALFPKERGAALTVNMRGNWTQVGTAGIVTLWKWSPGPAAVRMIDGSTMAGGIR